MPRQSCGGSLPDDLVLQREDLGPWSVEALGPDMAAGLGVDQLRVDPHVVTQATRLAIWTGCMASRL